mgnify:CR=1 FL=1
MANTTIQVRTETRDRLRELRPDGTLDDAVSDLLDAAENRTFWREMDDWRSWVESLDGDAQRDPDQVRSTLARHVEALRR